MSIETNRIDEFTENSGVTIDGLLIKDGKVQGDVKLLNISDESPVKVNASGDVIAISSADFRALLGLAAIAVSGSYADLSNVPTQFNPSAHNHAASEINSGTFANARISEANVTQHVAALLANAALTGTPTAPNVAQGDNSTKVANTAFVIAELAALADSSPDALNTLNELAAALGDDPNFAATVNNSIALKLPKTGAENGATSQAQRFVNGVYGGSSGSYGVSASGDLNAKDAITLIGTDAIDRSLKVYTSSSSGSAHLRVGSSDSFHYDIFRLGSSADIGHNATQSNADLFWSIADVEKLRIATSVSQFNTKVQIANSDPTLAGLQIDAASSQSNNVIEVNTNGGSGGNLLALSNAGELSAPTIDITNGTETYIKSTKLGYATHYQAVQIGTATNANSLNVAVALGFDPSTVAGGNFSGDEVVLLPNVAEFMQVNSAGDNWLNNVMVFNDGDVSFNGEVTCDGGNITLVQQAAISDPSGGITVDAEARTAINTVIDRLQAIGLLA